MYNGPNEIHHFFFLLYYAPLPHVVEFGGDGTFHGCKVIT